MKTLKERSKDAFGDDERSEVDEYLALVLSSWKDVAATMNRSAMLGLGLIALFELLIAQKSLDNLEIGSFTFTNISILQIAIPVIVASSIFNLLYLAKRWVDHQQVYYDLTERFHPGVARNNLAFLIRPQVSAFLRVGAGRPKTENARNADLFSDRVISVFSVLIGWTLPLAFEIQAFVHLFSVYGLSNAVLWVSLAISVGLMCCNYIYGRLIAQGLGLHAERKQSSASSKLDR
jgi:hypothetical protein